MGGNVIVVTSKAHWDELIAQTREGKVAIVDFFATWCGPCRMIAPYFEELSTANTDVLFLKVDVDTVEAVAAEAGISAMPTFQVWKNGAKADELVGASKERLADMLARNK